MKKLFAIFSCLILLGCNIPTNTEVEEPITTPEVPTVEQPKTYTVTFMNGNSVYETQIVEDGKKVIWPINNPSYSEDYEFVYWYPESEIITSDTVFKSIYTYNLYEITEGTFISNYTTKYEELIKHSYSKLMELFQYYDDNGYDVDAIDYIRRELIYLSIEEKKVTNGTFIDSHYTEYYKKYYSKSDLNKE
jgi:hypothetical protein